MLTLLFKSFIRSRVAIVGLMVVLLTGIISIYIGRQHLQKQMNSAAMTEHFQQEHIQRNVQFFNKEMGLVLYYLRFGLVNQTHPLNGLTIGQRDINSSIQSVTIRNLESQKYDTDLFNPFNLLTGNLDFSFVLIYLLPLLIISFSYNLLSEEREGGTWKLVSSQSNYPFKLLLRKLFVRAIAITAVLLVLMLLASGILALPFDNSFMAVVAIAVLYLLFWFAICLWVISLQKKSSTNAVILLSAWMLLTVILPGAVNNYILSKYPVPEAMATVVAQREGLHEKWDMGKRITMDRFYAHYPQLSKYSLPDGQFSWLWYYAMQQMGDDESRVQAKEMQDKLWQREKTSELIARFVPTLHTQHQLNTIARAGLSDHLQFLDSTTKFHEKMRLHFYPKIFGEAPVMSENWNTFKMEHFSGESRTNWTTMLIPLILASTLFVILGFVNFRKVPQHGQI
jgi:ABC-2 type transport system permease protein